MDGMIVQDEAIQWRFLGWITLDSTNWDFIEKYERTLSLSSLLLLLWISNILLILSIMNTFSI